MSNIGNYLFCDHRQQSVSRKTLRRHMALDQSRKLKRSLNRDSSTSSSKTEGENDFNSGEFAGTV